jgi:hypothetical protein
MNFIVISAPMKKTTSCRNSAELMFMTLPG